MHPRLPDTHEHGTEASPEDVSRRIFSHHLVEVQQRVGQCMGHAHGPGEHSNRLRATGTLTTWLTWFHTPGPSAPGRPKHQAWGSKRFTRFHVHEECVVYVKRGTRPLAAYAGPVYVQDPYTTLRVSTPEIYERDLKLLSCSRTVCFVTQYWWMKPPMAIMARRECLISARR